MAKKKGGLTVTKVWELCEPIVKDFGLSLWDVRYVKEGADWFLRVYIDKPDGIDITDCENVSRAIDKLLDELMGKPIQKEENAPNPSVAKTEKSPQSEPTSEQPKKFAEGATMTKEKPSVREELRKIKENRKEQEAEIGTSALDKSGASDRAKSANGKTEHKQPQRKKKKPKSKETR